MIKALSRQDLSPPQRLEACRRLIAFGEIGLAVLHLTALSEVPGYEGRVANLLRQCRRLRSMNVRPPPKAGEAVDAGGSAGFWCAPAGSDTTVVAFTGRSRRLGVSMYFMQGLLSEHGVNAVYLFDWSNALFLAGVAGLGRDVPSTVAALSGILAEMGTKRLICLGQSWGGYATIRYGVELGADAIIAFSPIVMALRFEERWKTVCAAAGVAVEEEELDPRVVLERRSPRPRTWIIHGDRNRPDTEAACHFDGVPGLIRLPVAGVSQHNILAPLAVSGRFSPLFRKVCDEVGPGHWGTGSADQ